MTTDQTPGITCSPIGCHVSQSSLCTFVTTYKPNVAHAHVMPYSDVSTYHILWSDVVVIESSALTNTAAEA